MQYREISRILGLYLYIFAIALLIPLGIAFYYQFIAHPDLHPQPHSTLAFLETVVICLLLALLFRRFGRSSHGQLYRREGLVLSVSIWFLTAAISALPFQFSGTFSNFVDSYWEAMSGLTTTGSTVMEAKRYDHAGKELPIIAPDLPTVYAYYGTITPVRNEQGEVVLEGIEAVGKGVLFWRSFTQWLGGMGIVVLFLSVLPALGVGGKVLYQSEVPGPLKDSMTPRIRDTASLLWKTYLLLSVVLMIILMVTNRELPFFDALCISCSTISTGGFGIRNNSIASYNNGWTELVVILFMIVGSINFVHYVSLARGKFSRLWDPELLFFFFVLSGMTLLITLFLKGTPEIPLSAERAEASELFNWFSSLRYAAFQLVSAQTTTGFTTTNYDVWPYGTQVLLLTAMFIGGMSGSTAGGMKVIRYSMLFKVTIDKIESIFRPNSVQVMQIGRSRISHDKAITVLCFFFIVIALTAIGTFILVLDGVDLETAFSIQGCCLNNTGLAFRMAGPANTFAFLPLMSKLIEILLMVAGRLEYFAILILFIPDFWRGR